MKRISLIAVILLIVLVISGCSNDTETTNNTKESSSVAKTTAKREVDRFSEQTEMGEGTMDLAHTSGNTKDGDEIIVYHDENKFPTSIGIETAGIDGSKLSYLYVDGHLVAEEQLGDSIQTIQLQDTPMAIVEGSHRIQLVQYTDDKENDEIVTFKQQPYTLKIKE